MNIFCCLGFHNWDKWEYGQPIYRTKSGFRALTGLTFTIHYSLTKRKRKCCNCGLMQMKTDYNDEVK